MPYKKLSNATHRKVFFYNLKKSQPILYHSDSDVKAAIHQNEHIILNIEKKKTFRKHSQTRKGTYYILL